MLVEPQSVAPRIAFLGLVVAGLVGEAESLRAIVVPIEVDLLQLFLLVRRGTHFLLRVVGGDHFEQVEFASGPACEPIPEAIVAGAPHHPRVAAFVFVDIEIDSAVHIVEVLFVRFGE